MKKRTFALLASAVMAAAAMAGCSSNKGTETTAAATSSEVSAKAGTTEAATEPADTAVKADIIVAGGDGAGLIAAIQAVKDGADPAKVIIVEKSGSLASDIAGMGEFMNASNTDEQFDQEIEDSPELYLEDMLKAGNQKNNADLAEFVSGSSEMALEWLSSMDMGLEGVDQEEGSSVARSYKVRGDKKLQDLLTETLTKQVEDMKIQVMKNTTVEEFLFDKDGRVEGIRVKGENGEETISSYTLLVTDKELLPLMDKAPSVSFTANDAGEHTGVLINENSEVLNSEGETVSGLYAAGSMTDAAVHGDKALSGNQITCMILFGTAAGTEMDIYGQDNK